MLIQKILVRGVNWLGDAVMSTPALARLREAYPQAELTLLTPSGLGDLWQDQPYLDHWIPFASGENPWQIARKLRARRFDLGLVFPNSPRSALELFLAGIPRRVGYGRSWRRWLLTDPVPPRPAEVAMRKRSTREIHRLTAQGGPIPAKRYPRGAHHIHQYLYLAAAAGASDTPSAPRLVVSAQEISKARETLLAGQDRTIRWLGMNPGAAYGPAKCWPAERFAQVASVVHEKTGLGWLVFGGPAEVDSAADLVRGLRQAEVGPVVNLAGKTTLRELCAGFKMCEALLTNDSGPMHLAAALGTPVVAVFGSTSPQLTGPGHPEQPRPDRERVVCESVPCAPCFRRDCPIDLRCLTRVKADRVARALLQILGDKGAGRPK